MKRLPVSLFVLILLAWTAGASRADLVGLWRFDEEASPGLDSSGNDHTGQIRGDAAWVNDPERGGVMDFDGDQDYLEVEDTDLLSIEGDITIAAWANFVSFESWNSIVSKSGADETNKPAPYDMYTSNNNNGRVSMFIGNGSNSLQNNIATDPPELGVWQHIAATVSADGEVFHYLNGEPNGEGTIEAEAVDNDTNLFIGSRADFVTNMLGQLDDVAIFNEVLTPEQINTIRLGDFGPFGVGGDFILGDFNSDGVLNLDDYNIMLANFHMVGAYADGDLDFDGVVGFTDFVGFRKAWHAANPVGAAVSVPEPSCMAVFGTLLLLLWRQPKGRGVRSTA